MPVIFSALPTEPVVRVRGGGPDANGQPAERRVSDGAGTPCRHCLNHVPAGREVLVLGWRPFPAPQPYAELGPIFLCADACARHPDGPDLPAMFAAWPRLLMRGYGPDDRIVYGTGEVLESHAIPAAAEMLFEDPGVAYIHLRSATNNCYQARIDRA